jgi:hypothetical protein
VPCNDSPGHYADPVFEPPIEFDLGDGWKNVANARESITFIRSFVEFLEINANLARFFEDAEPESSQASVELDPTTEAFLEWINGRETLDVGDQVETTVAGMPAVQIDAVGMPETQFLFAYSEGSARYLLDDGQRLRFISMMVGDDHILIAVEAPDPDFDELWSHAQVFIDSLEFVGN